MDKKENLTDKYYEDKKGDRRKVAEEVADYKKSIFEIIDSIYDGRSMQPENARKNNVELHVNEEILNMPEFKEMWSKMSHKAVYEVKFDIEELISNAIMALDSKLRVSKIYIKVETGVMNQAISKENLQSGTAIVKENIENYEYAATGSSNVKYDLIGKLVEETKLTRKDVTRILQGVLPSTFQQFKDNPEEFIIKAATLINDEKANAIIKHITYHVLNERYTLELFTGRTIRGRLGENAIKAKKHLYDYIVYDSENERRFAEGLDNNKDVAVYVKLPEDFYISTPVGRYNPDWAIAFYKGTVKHIYFVIETKGSIDSKQLREVEAAKIHCAREYFKSISSGDVAYDVLDGTEELIQLAMRE